MKKGFAFLVSITLSLSTIFASACGKGNKNSSNGNENGGLVHLAGNEPVSFEKTEYNLVSNGNSDYKIVIPLEATTTETVAAEELQLFIEKSTGCTLSIVRDNEIGDASGGSYLSVGKTTLLEARTEIVLDYSVMHDCGPSIKTIDDDVYMCGAEQTGTLYSVYKFLYYEIGFVAYALDCVKFDYYPTELKLLNFDYNYLPTIDVMTTAAKEYLHTADTREGQLNAMRMYMLPWGIEESYTLEGKEYTMFCHTMNYIVSEARYADIHPEWFNNGQPCLTNPEYIEEFTKNFLELYVIPYDNPYIMFGGNDNNGYCTCDNCKKEYELHGGTGGAFVRFANTVAAKVENYLAENQINKEIRIVIMAYAGYNMAPVVENPDGSISPVDESVICDSEGPVKVGVDCSFLHMCLSHSLDDEECTINQYYNLSYKGWDVLTDYLTIYRYTTHYQQPKFFFNDYWALSDDVNALKEHDTRWVYDAGKFRQPLNAMRFYVRRQMMWDNGQSVEALIDEFIEEYYGVASPYVKEYFEALCQQTEAFYKLTGNTCVKSFTPVGGAVNWPLEIWRNYAGLLENAMYAIDNSAMTEIDKEVYRERVYREWVLVKVNEYSLYQASLDDQTLSELEEIVKYAKEVYNLVYF